MKQERATIMALTFSIGFLTAFIAYGVDTNYSLPNLSIAQLTNKQQTATAIEARPAAEKLSQSGATVVLEAEGLFYQASETATKEVISVSVGVADDLVAEAHEAVYNPLVSDDGQFVFYCATLAGDSSECDTFIYDAAEKIIYPLKSANQKIVIEPDQIRAAWASDGRLQLGQLVSIAAATPWILE